MRLKDRRDEETKNKIKKKNRLLLQNLKFVKKCSKCILELKPLRHVRTVARRKIRVLLGLLANLLTFEYRVSVLPLY